MTVATPSIVDYYVYYTVAPDAAAAARTRIATLFAAVRAQWPIQPRLQIRVNTPAGEPATWMEIYPGVPADAGDFAAALARMAGHAGMDAIGTRHLECFADAEPMPCA